MSETPLGRLVRRLISEEGPISVARYMTLALGHPELGYYVTRDPLGRSGAAAGLLAAEGTAAVVVDCETSYVRLGLAEELARQLGAPAVRLAHLRADSLTRLVTAGTELGAA